jgi:flagellar biosynthesis protein FliR
MPSEASLALTTIYAFLVVLARVSGAVIFVPMPGLSASAEPVRVVFALSLTIALFPLWPVIGVTPGVGLLVGWMLSEAALGITVGLVTAFLSEAFAVFGQIIGLQAGYSFASTVDPNTEADSGMLIVLSQNISGLLFFALGLHREVLRIFAHSLETQPPGSFALTAVTANSVIRLSSTIFTTGLKLALPMIALMVMVDLALALLGRINSHLQLLSLAFPAKMLASLAMLSAIAGLLPRVYQAYAGHLVTALQALVGR